MVEVRQSEEFRRWFDRLRDIRARAQIVRRIERLEAGNPGDVAPVGEGVSEMRIHYGPGYRLYFVQRGSVWVLLLCGGTKEGQSRDIAFALKLAKEVD
jgi:putative addiction module killer protein